MGCWDRYDITASASKLPTLRLVAMCVPPIGVCRRGGTPRCDRWSGGAGRVVHGREAALGVRTAQVGQVLAGEHSGQLGDAAAVNADLAVSHLPREHNAPAAGGVTAFGVLHPPA